MKKLKELWGKNKVLIILGIILLICLGAILAVTFSFFLGGSKSVYGNRLDDISKHPITENFKSEYVDNLKKDTSISSVKINVKGRIIYVDIDFVADTSLVDAESKAAASLASFSEDILSYYDVSFVLKADASENSEGFSILGAKNVAGSGLVWNNNTPVESE